MDLDSAELHDTNFVRACNPETGQVKLTVFIRSDVCFFGIFSQMGKHQPKSSLSNNPSQNNK